MTKISKIKLTPKKDDGIKITNTLSSFPCRGGASPEKVGWKRDKIDGQKVYLTNFMSFSLRNEYRPEESGVDMSTPVHPVAPPLFPCAFFQIVDTTF